MYSGTMHARPGKTTTCFGFSSLRYPCLCSARVLLHVHVMSDLISAGCAQSKKIRVPWPVEDNPSGPIAVWTTCSARVPHVWEKQEKTGHHHDAIKGIAREQTNAKKLGGRPAVWRIGWEGADKHRTPTTQDMKTHGERSGANHHAPFRTKLDRRSMACILVQGSTIDSS